MTYEIIIQVLIVLAAAVVTGEIFEQFRLPSVAGQLLSGILLGPTIFNIVSTNQELQGISSIALFFIIFLIGFEMSTKTVREHVRHGLLLTGSSFLLPMFFIFSIAVLLLPFGVTSDFVTALAIAVPSISIISVLVMQYNLLEKETGRIILSTVAITDIVAFVLLAAVSTPIFNTISVIVYTIILVAAFIALDVVLNRQPKTFRRMIERANSLVRGEDVPYAVLILAGLSMAAIFQAIGLSYIIGAFFAGLIVHDGLIGRKAFHEVSITFARMNRAFFIPLFFGLAGLEADLQASSYPLLPDIGAIIVVTLLLSILLTYYATTRILRVKEKGGARQIAVTLGGRGAVGIVIASVAVSSGVINDAAYSLIIVATLVISLVVPVLLGMKESPGLRSE
ncbi:MAG: cation:proton antiporter [Nitrososphaerota archaeon]|nr:cation:proton antiporter [Nitrososphaerota archaeon]